MTEDEAKTKWCPFARYREAVTARALAPVVEDAAAWNRSKFTNKETGAKEECMTHCIASACMAWRWNKKDYDGEGRPVQTIDTGYCGLAGTP